MHWTIVAPTGAFPSVAAAAAGEASLDWTARETADHRACTLCYAAEELAAIFRSTDDAHGCLLQYSAAELAAMGRPVQQPCTVDLQPWNPAAEVAPHPSITLLTLADLETHPEACERLTKLYGELPTPPTGQSFAIRQELDAGGRGCPEPQFLILGGDRAGALYGAYSLLAAIEVRWFGPDPWDHRSLWDLVPGYLADETPSFELRGFWVFTNRGGNDFVRWMARNRLNLWSKGAQDKPLCRKLGMLFQAGIHDQIRKYLPLAKFFQAHPEWYSLRGGRRSDNVADGGGDNFCLANAAARAEFARALVADLIGGDEKWTDYLAVVPCDGGHWCECADCTACGTPTDRWMLLVHDCRQAVLAARAAGRLHREVKIGTTAYLETKLPPTRPLPANFDHAGSFVTFFPIERCYAHTFAAPECTELNVPICTDYEGWANPHCHFRGMQIVGEYYNVSKFAGMAIPFYRTMAADIPYYHRSGARGMHYMHPTTADWGTLCLTNWQFAAQLWDVRRDPEEILHDYFVYRYEALSLPPHAAQLHGFYRRLEFALRTVQQLKHIVTLPQEKNHLFHRLRIPGNPQNWVRYFCSSHLQLDYSALTVNGGPSLAESIAAIDQAAAALAHLEAAVAAVGPGRAGMLAARLAADRRRFDYTRHMLYFYWHFARLRDCENRGDSAGAAAEARSLRDHGEALRAENVVTRNGCQDSEVLFRNGLYATWLSGPYVAVLQQYGIVVAPVDFDGVT